jgi:hypothetical protein
MRDGKLVPKHLARPLHEIKARSSLPRPNVIGDSIGGIEGLVNPSDGRRYTSKAQMRAENRARGLTEVGNESFPERKAPSEAQIAAEVAADVAMAYDALANGATVQDAKPMQDFIKADALQVPDASV